MRSSPLTHTVVVSPLVSVWTASPTSQSECADRTADRSKPDSITAPAGGTSASFVQSWSSRLSPSRPKKNRVERPLRVARPGAWTTSAMSMMRAWSAPEPEAAACPISTVHPGASQVGWLAQLQKGLMRWL